MPNKIYTAVPAAAPPPEKPVVGYIEPVPEFYNRLLASTRMTTKGLYEMNVLDEASKSRLESLEKTLPLQKNQNGSLISLSNHLTVTH